MDKILELDTGKLVEKAQCHELKEYFETIDRKNCYKIGAGARMDKRPIFFLEIVVSLRGEDTDLDFVSLEERLSVLKEFEMFGYTLKWGEDNSIICEKNLTESELKEEYEKLFSLLKDLAV